MADRRPKGTLVLIVCATAVVLAGAGAFLLFSGEHNALARQEDQLKQELAQGPVVRVAEVKVAPSERLVTLPAEVRADKRATLYAKISGYARKVLVDKGDKVKAGQEVAELESPDIDEQLRSAEAELTLRKQQRGRTERLAPAGRVSQQEREQAEEAVKVAEASVSRARAQKSYEILRAPFDGTVTGRFADPGTLLPAATGSTSSAQPLLEIADLSRLRVALNLAQDDAARVHVSDEVSLQIAADQPPLKARVSRISQALDARTRTMLCEIDLPHPPPGLYPGAFVETQLPLHGNPRPLVPTDALISVGGQMVVAIVENNHVHFQRVKLGADDGAQVEVLDGLRGGEAVALNLGADVSDGSPVRPQAAAGPSTR
ncbi:MAG: efflux RND transporter periplasmic adaptor subunit [Myxococcales bacterium]|nr:efflux RND transporter periplasmic adaptor subunit [Myxococcales bacterium]